LIKSETEGAKNKGHKAQGCTGYSTLFFNKFILDFNFIIRR
jgi:hypothetical protein